MVGLSFKQEVELEKLKHEHQMQQLAFQRETNRLKFEWEKEVNRIKSAEIRKAEERRYWYKTH